MSFAVPLDKIEDATLINLGNLDIDVAKLLSSHAPSAWVFQRLLAGREPKHAPRQIWEVQAAPDPLRPNVASTAWNHERNIADLLTAPARCLVPAFGGAD